MPAQKQNALSDILDELSASVEGETVSIGDITDRLGHSSFAAVILVFTLLSASPASAIPGLTAGVAVIVFLLVIQMIFGKSEPWLPGFIERRTISSEKLCKGIGWLRKPVRFVERFLKPRLHVLTHRPWLWLPLVLVLCLSVLMPFMEVIPTSGSLASVAIAIFAAGLLTRDGLVIAVSIALLSAVPVAIWLLGFGT
jgi:Uncharacterized ABC-type transport system, permease components